tara:strand:- start:6606 stop:7601 length:996 start_codon:yes stop_codon:yes gene_type:complete
MAFKDPWILLLIPFVLLFSLRVLQNQSSPAFRFSSTDILKGVGGSWKTRFSYIQLILRFAAISLFIIALAGPQSVLQKSFHKTEGIDIVLAIDSSGSMAAEDFTIREKRYNRLAVVKGVVKEFIQQRYGDRIGLISFAALAYTVSPLTTDYDWLNANLERIDLGLIKDGTAIGSAISSSLSRLKNSEAKSKVVILLTDGVSNAGKIDPLTAARAAKSLGIKIYTIGAGTEGYAPFPSKDIFGRSVYRNVLIKIDEKTLKKIAEITEASYFRATDEKSLREIYNEIDHLEKTEIEKIGYKEYKQLFTAFLVAALLLIAMELILSNTLFMKVP